MTFKITIEAKDDYKAREAIHAINVDMVILRIDYIEDDTYTATCEL